MLHQKCIDYILYWKGILKTEFNFSRVCGDQYFLEIGLFGAGDQNPCRSLSPKDVGWLTNVQQIYACSIQSNWAFIEIRTIRTTALCSYPCRSLSRRTTQGGCFDQYTQPDTSVTRGFIFRIFGISSTRTVTRTTNLRKDSQLLAIESVRSFHHLLSHRTSKIVISLAGDDPVWWSTLSVGLFACSGHPWIVGWSQVILKFLLGQKSPHKIRKSLDPLTSVSFMVIQKH